MAVHGRHGYVDLPALATLLLGAAAALCPAHATSLTVPDDLPSIQAALDAKVDTVFVRAGDYNETPVAEHPVTVLASAADSSAIPVIEGLRIHINRPDVSPAVYAFRRLQVNSRIVIVNERGSCDIDFAQCALLGGIADSSLLVDTVNMSLFKCRLAGVFEMLARGWIRVDSCEINGQISVCGDPILAVRGCMFQGGGDGTGVGSCGITGAYVEGNTLRDYRLGIAIFGEGAEITGNVVEDCSYAGIWANATSVVIRENSVRRLGTRAGIVVESPAGAGIFDNTVVAVAGTGIELAADATVVGNVVWGCGGEGMRFTAQPDRYWIRVSQNTSCLNGGSGLMWENYGNPPEHNEWTGNIGWGNGYYGLRWVAADSATLACNDWFANRAGEDPWRSPSSGDISVDPEFCNPDSGDFRLNSSSPLLDRPGCGQIGALGVGCGKTATLVQRFTASRASDGIRIVWEVAEGATASEVWLERSESGSGGPWLRPLTERSMENPAVVELDRTAVSDRAYWYRLMALEGNDATVIGSPIVVEAEARLEFRLVQVGPNPGSGPVRIAFALEHAATIEIDVFDVQGRRVASPARGMWPAGTHALEWNGLTRSGEVAPAGLYLVRYAYPGGQDRRRIVRVP